MFIENSTFIKQLSSWFEAQIEQAVPLTDEIIAEYEPIYRRNRKRRKKREKEQMLATKKWAGLGRAVMVRWDEAVKAAQKYFLGHRSKEAWVYGEDGGKRFLGDLRIADFTFE